MTEHSKLPPSSAARRMACPGSRRMEAMYPRESSEASREGTLAHEVCKRLLNEEKVDLELPHEMLSFCELYVNYLKRLSKGHQLCIEETIGIESIHPDMWGTPDAWFFTENHLHIFDFKYGFKPVEVFENWQLITYSAGIMEGDPSVDKVTFHIVQPRAMHTDGPIRTWSISSDELLMYWDRLRASEALAATEDAPLITGSGCEYCHARHACPVLRKDVLEGIENMKDLPEELSDDELGKELKRIHDFTELLKARATALEEEALTKLKMGNRIPFYQLGRSQPREKWVKPITEVLALGDLFDVDLKKPQEAITPKQAIKAGIPADLVRQYSETPIGELKLEQVKESETRQIFKK
jgi:hypothetical protein